MQKLTSRNHSLSFDEFLNESEKGNQKIENTGAPKKIEIKDIKNIPEVFTNNNLNIKNHLKTLKEHNLGPADPRESNEDFWKAKGTIWGCSEGDAGGRLCMNCEHYLMTTEVKTVIDNTENKNFKTSMVGDGSFVDIESKPVALCTLYNITCSPTRTCDSQEMGGPIDDMKAKLYEISKLTRDTADLDEYKDPFKK